MKTLMRGAALSFALLMAAPVHASPEAAIAQELERVAATGEIAGARIASADFLASFYGLRDDRPAWFGQASAEQLLAALTFALDQGFRPPDFHAGLLFELRDAARTGDDPAVAAFDVLATDAAIRLVFQLIYGKVDPARLDPAWTFERPVIERNPAQVLAEYLSGPGFAALVEEVAIREPQYLEMVAALARYRALDAAGGWEPLPEGPAMKPGETDARVPALRERLAVEGEIDSPLPETGAEAEFYDPVLEQAVMRFQRRHGLEADGVIGPRTLASLNRPASDRVNKLRLSLERFRWYIRGLGDDFVLVNIAGARTFVVLDGELAWTTRSITGSAYRQTPVFADAIQYMEINPTWSVPASIFRNDKLPRIRKDPGYLERNGYVVRNSAGETIPASAVNWGASNPGVSIMQKPGPENALGRIKFMFPNEHAVYLHDTNDRSLFDRDERNLSSGCVRVEDPFAFAGLLMRDDPAWTQERLQEILDSGRTTRVDLPKPMPVLLTYWTAWVENGVVQFREDPYERDAKVLAALDKAP